MPDLVCWGSSQLSMDAPVPAKGGDLGWSEKSSVFELGVSQWMVTESC